jgi:hypothetical protein
MSGVIDIRLDEFGRARIPIQPCLRTCENVISPALRVTLRLTASEPMTFSIRDSFGYGDSERMTPEAELRIAPALDSRYRTPMGLEVDRRDYFLEIDAGPQPEPPTSVTVELKFLE